MLSRSTASKRASAPRILSKRRNPHANNLSNPWRGVFDSHGSARVLHNQARSAGAAGQAIHQADGQGQEGVIKLKDVLTRMQEIDADRKIADFIVKQKQDYDFKKAYARIRAIEFRKECDKRGLNYHVSVGGLDSITLYLFLKSIGIQAPAISVSHLEDCSVQDVH